MSGISEHGTFSTVNVPPTHKGQAVAGCVKCLVKVAEAEVALVTAQTAHEIIPFLCWCMEALCSMWTGGCLWMFLRENAQALRGDAQAHHCPVAKDL